MRIKSIVLVVLLLAGCNETSSEKMSTYAATYDEQKLGEVQKMIEKNKDVRSAHIVQVDDVLIVSIEPKPYKRYKKQKIEEQLQKQIEEQISIDNVLVSADFKVQWELKKIVKLKDEEKKAEKIKALFDLAKEET